MSGRLLVIAAGGTGGHMFPAQALAEAMLAKGWRVRLTTDKRGARYTSGFPAAVEVVTLRSGTLARGGLVAKALVPLQLIGGILAALLGFLRERPDVVVGFGGYPAIPAMGAAFLARVPRMLHEQNGVLGRVNQLFARHVHAVACGTADTKLPKGVMSEHTGNPVREAILTRAAAPYETGHDCPITILVVGGSQGARILSDVVPEAISNLSRELRERVHVVQQARPEDVARVSEHYVGKGIQAEVQTFYADIPDRLAQAQVVVCRSGASTVADVAIVGRPAIFVPLAAAIRDEQTANARALVEAGAAKLIPEEKLDPAILTAQLTEILSNPEQARNMARAALQCGVPDATERLVSMVERVAGTKDSK